jgi:hypothetical protein
MATLWNRLPHLVQAVIVLFAGTAVGSIAQAIETPNACWTLACWHGYLITGGQAGVLAVAGLYLKSSLYNHPMP